MVSMKVETKFNHNKPKKTVVWITNAHANRLLCRFTGPLWRKKKHSAIANNKMLQKQNQLKKDISSVIFRANIKEICWNRHGLTFTFFYSITQELS